MNLLFSSGLPRSGTNLITKALSVHEKIIYACGPAIEIYRYHRNHILKKYGSFELQNFVKPTDPILAYFGNDHLINFLDIILESSFDEIFDQSLNNNFFLAIKNRVDHDSKDLLENIESIKGESFSEIIKNLAQHIQITRKKISNDGYVGIHESWNIDSFPALAKSFPMAKFIVIMRDPRATINSSLGFAKNRPDTRAQIISFCRHFRKYVRLINRFMSDSCFNNKLLVIKHEDTLNNPRFVISKICQFLNLDFNENLLDPSLYYDYATKSIWNGNSAFEKKVKNFDSNRNIRWKKTLTSNEIKSIEYLCYEEMIAMNYELINKFPLNKKDLTNIFNFLFDHDFTQKVKWRTDLGKPILDFGFESFRSSVDLLNFHDTETVRLCNLFQDSLNIENLNQFFLKQ